MSLDYRCPDPRCRSRGCPGCPDPRDERIAELERRIAELEGDGAYLDWLEHNAATLHCNFVAGPRAWSVTIDLPDFSGQVANHGGSVRAAIGASMQEHRHAA